MHPDLLRVAAPPQAGAVARDFESQRLDVVAAYPGAAVVSMTEPGSATQPTRFSLSMPDGTARDAFVDPWRGGVLGDLDPDTTISGTAVRLHADLMSGPVGDAVLELGACWAIVMALSGYYLFWRAAGPRAPPTHRHRAGTAAHLARGNRRRGRWRASAARRQRPAVDGSVGRERAEARDERRDVAVERGPRRPVRPDLHARRVPPAQPRGPLGAGQEPGAHERPERDGTVGCDRGRRAARRGGRRARAPDDRRPASGQGGRRAVRHRVRLQRPWPGTVRAHRPVRRDCRLPVRLGQSTPPLRRPSRKASPCTRADASARSTWSSRPRSASRSSPCASPDPRCGGSHAHADRAGSAPPRGRMPLRATPLLAIAAIVLAVTLPLFGISLLVVLLLDQLVLRVSPQPEPGSTSHPDPKVPGEKRTRG